MHKKGAKLSLVHLFGLTKINRNYIQKGREIRRNMKRMKKVLSIVLSLAMILTSITVYNTKTAKAQGENVNAKFSFGKIERYESTDSQYLVYFVWDKVKNDNNQDVNKYETYEIYSVNGDQETLLATSKGNYEAVNVGFCQSYTFKIKAYDGEELKEEDTIDWTWPDNYSFNLKATIGKNIVLKWDRITNAVRYELYNNGICINKNIWTDSAKETYSVKPEIGSYTFTVKAYDADNNIITQSVKNKDSATVTINDAGDEKEPATQDPITLTGDEVWKAFDRKTKNNNATVYVEEAALSGILSDSRIRGTYDKASDPQNWNNVTDAVIGDKPVFGFLKPTTDLIIVDETGVGYRYTNTTKMTNTEVWRGGNDCNYINQTLIDAKPGETKLFRVTLTSGDSFLIRVVGEESEQYTATVDGEELAVTNNTVTLPTTADYGYYCKGKMYKKGSVVTLEENMAFTSVNKLDLTITNGVSIRLVIGETGLRYKATITSDNNEAINSDAIQEGILITTQANYNGSNSNIEIGSDNVLNVANVSETNNKWYAEKNDTANNEYGGTFCGSIIKMIDSNIPRPFVARAYVTIKYEGDSDATVIKYTDVIGKKSIQDIAKLIQKGSKYKENGYNADEMQIIDDFAKYTDAQ